MGGTRKQQCGGCDVVHDAPADTTGVVWCAGNGDACFKTWLVKNPEEARLWRSVDSLSLEELATVHAELGLGARA